MAEPIDPALARKLYAFTVPPLTPGFAERLAQKAASLPQEAGSVPLPRSRRSTPRRRWRVATTGLGAIALGMMSISAAAMGYFGEPLREAVQRAPVVGPAIVTAIERVAPKRLAARLAPAPRAELAAKTPAADEASGVQAGVGALPTRLTDQSERHRILADPEERRAWLEAHPKVARRIEARQAARGEFLETHPRAAGLIEERRAAREAGATPREMRQLRREQIRELREQRAELRTVPRAEEPAVAPAARAIEQGSAPKVDQPADIPADAPVAASAGAGLQHRLERRELRQERRERRRQRMERQRP